jgi:hypothetical protein
MRAGWGVYCKDGHGCVGLFNTELEALELAVQMMEDEKRLMGGTPCIYDAIPMTIADMNEGPLEQGAEHPKGGYL